MWQAEARARAPLPVPVPPRAAAWTPPCETRVCAARVPGDPAGSADSLNVIYNLADVLNKIAFGVIIWNVAVTESEAKA